MHYPEFDALCHEVAGKLSELRRLTMETAVLTDDQEALGGQSAGRRSVNQAESEAREG